MVISKDAVPKDASIYIAGHNGLVGSAIVRALEKAGYNNLILKSSKELDLRNQSSVGDFYDQYKPQYVYLAAAKVGGILANDTYPAEFIYDNLMIETNLIHGAYLSGVKKLLFLGSTCIYPRMAPQPLKEESLLTGSLEPTNEWYAIAKIAGIKMCQAYRKQYGCNFVSAMPTNLYGPGDSFDLQNSHVLPALIRKFHEAKIKGDKEVIIWGTGKPKREFLYVDDCATACVHMMDSYDAEGFLNVGLGEDISIDGLARVIKKITGFSGEIVYDSSKPDGTPRKLVDVTKLNSSGWNATIEINEGIALTYDWFVENIINFKSLEI